MGILPSFTRPTSNLPMENVSSNLANNLFGHDLKSRPPALSLARIRFVKKPYTQKLRSGICPTNGIGTYLDISIVRFYFFLIMLIRFGL